MKISLKLISFALVCFFTFAENEECLRSDIHLENTERLGKNSYSHGDTVKINCISGYSGMYKFSCNNGKWEKKKEQTCSKKKCGHPGDTQNGNFRLLEGNKEFVFGATVEYTCNKGYEMVSRINQRTCRINGWDNTVPTCEGKQCPPINAEEGLTASGNTEEGRYSDVIHFECVSPDKKIVGKTDIHCTEAGVWSDPVPKCTEITCTPPDILHGTVTLKTEYKKDATLQYQCNTGYKPRQGTPRCTAFGWSLKPDCEEISCELKETKFGIQKIVPQGITFFRAGDTVQITCSKKYRIFSSKETVGTFTCQNGQWEGSPVCEEVRCEVPQNRRLSQPDDYFYGDLKLDVERTYECLSGFRKTAERAVCTEDGWKPNPLCAEYVCKPPIISNAQIRTPDFAKTQYKIFSTIVYSCDPGFEPEQNIRITCDYPGKWSGVRPCTEKKRFCATPDLRNGYILQDSHQEDRIYYSCNAGYKLFSGNWWGEARCTNGRWSDEPQCIRLEECGSLPSVEHGRVRTTNSLDEESAEVQCEQGFKASHTLIRCVNGTWEKPVCELNKQHCVNPPKVENAAIASKPQEWYFSGSHVVYICRKHFQINGNRRVYCSNTIWDTPPTCEDDENISYKNIF